jgi:hypothetical protein
MRCEYGDCKKQATIECGMMNLDMKLKMIKLCDKCLRIMSKGKCVIDGQNLK